MEANMKRLTLDIDQELFHALAKDAGVGDDIYSIEDTTKRDRMITEEIKMKLYKDFGFEPPMRADEKRRVLQRKRRLERLKREMEELESSVSTLEN